MKLTRVIGVIFLSLILIMLLFLLSFSFIASSFLYPNIYLDAFERGDIYEYVDGSLRNAEGATFIAVPEGGSKVLIERLLTNFLAYMRSDTDKLDLTVKVDTVKLRNFFLDSVSNLDSCKRIDIDPYNENNPCIPAGVNESQYLDEYLKRKNLDFFASDTVDLAGVYNIEEGSEGRRSLDSLREYIAYYQLSNILLIVAALAILFLLYLMEKPMAFLITSAICFFIPAIILFTIVYFTAKVPETIVLPDPLLLKLMTSVIDVVSSKLAISGSILAVISMVFLIFSFTIKKSTEKLSKKGRIKV